MSALETLTSIGTEEEQEMPVETKPGSLNFGGIEVQVAPPDEREIKRIRFETLDKCEKEVRDVMARYKKALSDEDESGVFKHRQEITLLDLGAMAQNAVHYAVIEAERTRRLNQGNLDRYEKDNLTGASRKLDEQFSGGPVDSKTRGCIRELREIMTRTFNAPVPENWQLSEESVVKTLGFIDYQKL